MAEDDAARSFDKAAIKLRGSRAKLNFVYSDYIGPGGVLVEDPKLRQAMQKLESLQAAGGAAGSSKAAAESDSAASGSALAAANGGGASKGDGHERSPHAARTSTGTAKPQQPQLQAQHRQHHEGAGGQPEGHFTHYAMHQQSPSGASVPGLPLPRSQHLHQLPPSPAASRGGAPHAGHMHQQYGVPPAGAHTQGPMAASALQAASAGLYDPAHQQHKQQQQGQHQAQQQLRTGTARPVSTHVQALILRELPPGCSVLSLVPNRFANSKEDMCGALYLDGQMPGLVGSAVWTGSSNIKMGMYDTERDARQACIKCMQLYWAFCSDEWRVDFYNALSSNESGTGVDPAGHGAGSAGPSGAAGGMQQQPSQAQQRHQQGMLMGGVAMAAGGPSGDAGLGMSMPLAHSQVGGLAAGGSGSGGGNGAGSQSQSQSAYAEIFSYMAGLKGGMGNEEGMDADGIAAVQPLDLGGLSHAGGSGGGGHSQPMGHGKRGGPESDAQASHLRHLHAHDMQHQQQQRQHQHHQQPPSKKMRMDSPPGGSGSDYAGGSNGHQHHQHMRQLGGGGSIGLGIGMGGGGAALKLEDLQLPSVLQQLAGVMQQQQHH